MSTSAKKKSRSASEEPARSPELARVDSRRGLLSESVGLKLLVFVSGAVLMGLEIVGSRILAPYFGNSVFVWGSLISLFLIALSLGYYIGGRLADRHPSRTVLGLIVIAVAISLFVVAAIARPVCDTILDQGFGEKSGPFLAAIVLFLLPSLGMGMVSPYAIRLDASAVGSVGRTAGTLYALSTLGSIAGTMLTTFILIPMVGAISIMTGLAITLLAVGIITFPFISGATLGQAAVVALLISGAAAYGISLTGDRLPPGETLISEANTPYHHITVVDNAKQGSRDLRFDRFRESIVELNSPHRSRSEYTYYFHLAFAAKPDIRRALFIGAGGGVGPRSFLMHNPEMEIDVVDIDPKVLELARTHFYMGDSPNIRSVAADGRSFVRDAKPGTYDCIVLDAFTIGGRIPFHLVTLEFLELCRDRLTPGGIFLMNINSAEIGPKAAIYRSMFKTLNAAFDGSAQAFVVGASQRPSEESRNIILVAIAGDKPLSRDEWAARAESYHSNSYIEPAHMQRMVQSLAAPPDVESAFLFTDDFAPIETMSF
jgi:spermidine synthase